MDFYNDSNFWESFLIFQSGVVFGIVLGGLATVVTAAL